MATVTDPDKTTSYTYDDNGNIKTIQAGSQLIAYTYNELSELVREDNQILNKTITSSYDAGGNLLEKKEYAYTTEPLGTPTRTIPYGYSDTNWKDKLTSFVGKAIAYDAIGNPLNFDGWTYTWEEGRQLKTQSKTGTSLSFKYNSSGLCTEKSVNGVPTKYTYLGGKVAFETTGAETFHYPYDGNGTPFSMTYNGSEYFYLTNLQGDVTGIADATGTTVVSYTYDSWGKLTSTIGSMASSLGVKNPWKISEEKVRDAEQYDGYYAAITKNLALTTEEVTTCYHGLWKIEESFRVLKTDLEASPVYVHTDKHIRGHFVLCFLALCIVRYTQYLVVEHEMSPMSAGVLMDTLEEPRVVVQGTFPDIILTPIQVSNTYLKLHKILGMKPLRKNMTLTQFRSVTKVDLMKNLK